MAVRKGYNRYFIIFQEEDKGYGIAIDKQPTGYAKIEIRNGKCKITVYAQNLKKEKGPYHFCMIDTAKTPSQFIKVGEVRIDEIGRGENWWEFNEDNIAESGCTMEKFNVALILTNGEYMLAPLVGYTGKEKIMWKEKMQAEGTKEHEHKHEHEHEHEHKHEHEHVCEDIKLEENCDEDRLMEDKTRGEVIGESVEEPIQLDEEALKFQRYEELLRNEDKLRENLTQVEEESYQENIEFELSRHKGNEKEHRVYKHHAKIFHKILEEFEEMKDFLEGNGSDNCRWWRIPYNCPVRMMEDKHYPFLCTIFHLNMTYPHIDYIKYFWERGYYYFGIKYDADNEIKHIMYGIEGSDQIREQPYMGMTGFGKWMKIKDMNMGVWVMFYNPRTGNFMVEKTE